MALSWNNFKEMTGKTGSLETPDQEEASHPANVLLQIVLPIVLILAFLVFVRVQILEEQASNFFILLDKVKEEPRGELLEEYRESLVELQRQRLLVALEKVKAERRRYFGIDAVSSIRIEAGQLLDGSFKIACEKTFSHLGNVRSRDAEANFIYQSVLDSAEIRDRGTGKSQGEWDILADPSIITNQNRDHVRRLIEGFIARLIGEATNLQYESIHEICEFYLVHDEEMEQLDPKLAKFREEYIHAPPEKKKLYAHKLHNRLVEKLTHGLEEQGFHFFEETWQRIKVSL